MSVRIMTRVWDAAFPTLPMKLIALKLADCANDEGENIYPSVGRVEAETGVCASVVRAALADMEASGLLVVIDDAFGNRRGRSTTVRAFDIECLKRLVGGQLVWEHQDVPVCDPATGQPKLRTDGSAKTRKAWRLVTATPPCGGGVGDQAPLRVAEGTPPCGGGGPLRVTDPTPPCDGGLYREPSIEPSDEPSHTHPSERVCVSERTLLDEIADEGSGAHVVEHLLRPLWGVLRGNPSLDLLRAMRDDLGTFGDAALADAAVKLRQTRSTWPSVAQAREAVQAAQALHMVRIEPGTTAWAAWSRHWHAKGHKFLARTYEAQGFAMVTRQFPPVEGGAR